MILPVLALLAAQSPRDDVIGRYTVVDEHGRIVCKLRLYVAPDVGDEIDAPKGCATVLPIDDGLRWHSNKDGSYTIRNALHRQVATISDSEGGYILYVGARHYDLAGVDYVPPAAPSVRAVGTWRFQNDAVPPKLLCRVTFQRGGLIGPTAACPVGLKPFGGGRWRGDADGITLQAPSGQVKRLSWEDDDDLNGDDLHLAVVRDRTR